MDRLDTRGARRSLICEAKQVGFQEVDALEGEGLHIATRHDKVAAQRGVGLGLYFKILPWLFWMMVWMTLCSVPYLIVINTSVFTDYDHKDDFAYGVKVYDRFVLPSFTFAAIVDDKKDNGTLQYMNTNIADTWKGPMKKGVFLTWLSLLDAGATLVLSAAVVAFFFVVDRWLERTDRKTREVSDYSVIVGGLPPTITATELGQYFQEHFGEDPKVDKVMDVVLVKDLAPVITACKKVHKYEQIKRFVDRIQGKDKDKGRNRHKGKSRAVKGKDTALAAEDKAHKAKTGHENESPKRASPQLPKSGLSPGKAGNKSSNGSSPANANNGNASNIAAELTHGSPTTHVAQKDGKKGVADGSVTHSADVSGTAGAAAGVADIEAVAGAAAAAAKGSALERESAGAAADGAGDTEAGGKTARLSRTLSLDMSRQMAEIEDKIRQQQSLIGSRLEAGMIHGEAAFVTFNTEKMRINVCKKLPSGWWSALVGPRRLRLRHAGRSWRIWVQRAAAPDDYRFENLATRIRTNMLIQVVTGVVMFLLMLVCAAFITWLSNQSNQTARDLIWRDQQVLAGIRSGWSRLSGSAWPAGAAPPSPLSGAPASSSPSSPVLSGRHRSLLSAVNAGENKTLYDTFCGSMMPSCTSYVNEKFADAHMNITFGSEWVFPSSTSRLLYERPVRQDLLQCSQETPPCEVSYCLPCYCMGLSDLPTSNASADFLSHIKDVCSEYMVPFDLRRDGLQTAISFVVAAINAVLVFVLRLLKVFAERHWTTTDTELSFAVWAYLVKVINSVAVLLIVNCSTLRNLQQKSAAMDSRWLRSFILDGLYDDFTPDWYKSVGFSIMVLLFINVTGPLVRSAVDYGLKLLMRWRLRSGHCGKLAAPEDYNLAFRSPQFTLEQRTSDIMFNLTLALLFGSGMPLCYLAVAAYLAVTLGWDRLCLLGLSQPAQRYQKDLPRAIMQLMPVLLLLHCAFGAWMHTYFKADLAAMSLAGKQGQAGQGIDTLSRNWVGRRITQPNGLPLLTWFVAQLVWLLFGRWIIWGALKLLGRGCVRLSALLRSLAEDDGASDVTYEEALTTVKVVHKLRGARTYRIHHLTGYQPYLKGNAGRLWATAQGEERYTRLTSFRVEVEIEVEDGSIERRVVNTFDVSDDVITAVPKIAPTTPSSAGPPLLSQLHSPQQMQPPQQPQPPQHPALSGLPSAALQAALLQHAATIQETSKGRRVVKRLTLHPSAALGGPTDSVPVIELVADGVVLPAAAAAALAAAGGGCVSGVVGDIATSASVPAGAHNVELADGRAIVTMSSAPVHVRRNVTARGAAAAPLEVSHVAGGTLRQPAGVGATAGNGSLLEEDAAQASAATPRSSSGSNSSDSLSPDAVTLAVDASSAPATHGGGASAAAGSVKSRARLMGAGDTDVARAAEPATEGNTAAATAEGRSQPDTRQRAVRPVDTAAAGGSTLPPSPPSPMSPGAASATDGGTPTALSAALCAKAALRMDERLFVAAVPSPPPGTTLPP